MNCAKQVKYREQKQNINVTFKLKTKLTLKKNISREEDSKKKIYLERNV